MAHLATEARSPGCRGADTCQGAQRQGEFCRALRSSERWDKKEEVEAGGIHEEICRQLHRTKTSIAIMAMLSGLGCSLVEKGDLARGPMLCVCVCVCHRWCRCSTRCVCVCHTWCRCSTPCVCVCHTWCRCSTRCVCVTGGADVAHGVCVSHVVQM